jgi:hypothetical protein
VRTRLTFLDFALGTAFPSIRLILDYEGTVSYRAIIPPLPMTFGKAAERWSNPAQGSVNFGLAGEVPDYAQSTRRNPCAGVNECDRLWLLKKSVSLKTAQISGIENVYPRCERRL